jgi:hypothetical protein
VGFVKYQEKERIAYAAGVPSPGRAYGGNGVWGERFKGWKGPRRGLAELRRSLAELRRSLAESLPDLAESLPDLAGSLPGPASLLYAHTGEAIFHGGKGAAKGSVTAEWVTRDNYLLYI